MRPSTPSARASILIDLRLAARRHASGHAIDQHGARQQQQRLHRTSDVTCAKRSRRARTPTRGWCALSVRGG
eukprot:1427437-Prymnesium_polylepis.2